ncbi:Syntaxin 6, N-terminal [Dillenia turbinata]|uniref:Syntaxin 6, N-terminal n=1 Tax=Dillenia turbinata TaxID=194707 RepID=A0AAN8W5D2_9MAGN
MLVANSFDLWQKDAFFSAAEEVQESADLLESAYRAWIREKRRGLAPEHLDELCRELKTALGTAKWQLEEFERAVRLSYGNRSDENTASRHGEFIAAIENQVSRIEMALTESLSEEGKKPLRWINLDPAECDDLALFLSGASDTVKSAKTEFVEPRSVLKSNLLDEQYEMEVSDLITKSSCSRDVADPMNSLKDVVTINEDKYVIEVDPNDEISCTRDDANCQVDMMTGASKFWSSPNFGSWKVVVADEDEEKTTPGTSMEQVDEVKGSKPAFWRHSCVERLLARRGGYSYVHRRTINWMHQTMNMYRKECEEKMKPEATSDLRAPTCRPASRILGLGPMKSHGSDDDVDDDDDDEDDDDAKTLE